MSGPKALGTRLAAKPFVISVLVILVLSVVGYPAAVNPDRKLSLLANAYHWPIIRLAA